MNKITNPKREALAFRIWSYATEREWNVSVKDLAELTGESWHRIKGTCQAKGWISRMRKDSASDGSWNRPTVYSDGAHAYGDDLADLIGGPELW